MESLIQVIRIACRSRGRGCDQVELICESFTNCGSEHSYNLHEICDSISFSNPLMAQTLKDLIQSGMRLFLWVCLALLGCHSGHFR